MKSVVSIVSIVLMVSIELSKRVEVKHEFIRREKRKQKSPVTYLVSDSYVTSNVRLLMSLPNALHAGPARLSWADRVFSVSFNPVKVYPNKNKNN